MKKNSSKLILKPELSTIQEVQDLARKLMDDYGLIDWTFSFSSKTSYLGVCYSGQKRIVLQLKHVAENIGKLGDNLVDTILHEIAHALNHVHGTGKNHDKAWKNWCKRIGAAPFRCAQMPRYRIVIADTGEVVGEYLHLPLWANEIGSAMLEGREDTCGKLCMEVLENDDYIPADRAERSVQLCQCTFKRAVAIAPDNTASEITVSDERREDLADMLFSGFKHDQFYRFNSSERFESPSLYSQAKKIFRGESADENMRVAGMLWATKIAKPGTDVYAVRLSGCVVGARRVDALGLFSIAKEQRLTTVSDENGIGFVKVPFIRVIAGCVIFNDAEHDGFLVSVFNQSKSNGVLSCLELVPDNKILTKYVVRSVQQFVKEVLPEDEDSTKENELNILQNACDYVNAVSEFNLDNFVAHVAPNSATAELLKDFLECNSPPGAVDQFTISAPDALQVTRSVKKVIRLDDNFTIHVHTDPRLVLRMSDPGEERSYYKIYFNEEK